VRLDRSGALHSERFPESVDLHAVARGPDGLMVGGAGRLWVHRSARWEPIDLPDPRAHVRAIGWLRGTLVVAGAVDRETGSTAWAAERGPDGWKTRTLGTLPAVFELVPDADRLLMVADSTPLYWSQDRPQLTLLLPAQDVHPRVLALDRRADGWVAAGIDSAWTLTGGRLMRELHRLHHRLVSVTSLPGGAAVAVGRASPPGGHRGGVAYHRAPAGQWTRELFTPDEALADVVRCGPRVVAVGQRGLVVLRAGSGTRP